MIATRLISQTICAAVLLSLSSLGDAHAQLTRAQQAVYASNANICVDRYEKKVRIINNTREVAARALAGLQADLKAHLGGRGSFGAIAEETARLTRAIAAAEERLQRLSVLAQPRLTDAANEYASCLKDALAAAQKVAAPVAPVPQGGVRVVVPQGGPRVPPGGVRVVVPPSGPRIVVPQGGTRVVKTGKGWRTSTTTWRGDKWRGSKTVIIGKSGKDIGRQVGKGAGKVGKGPGKTITIGKGIGKVGKGPGKGGGRPCHHQPGTSKMHCGAG